MLRGTIDGRPFQSSFTAPGDGTHKLPVRADLRKAVGKEAVSNEAVSNEAGDTVTVRLKERLEG